MLDSRKMRHGNYEIIREIGRGGACVVYLAEDVILKRLVALKVFPAEFSPDVSQVKREEGILSRLNHPNIVTVYSAGVGEGKDGSLHIAMEFIDGPSLEQVIRESGRLPEPQAAELIRQTAEGLGAAHAQNIVHCDIKPSNILLTKSGQVKIADFGLARLLKTDTEARGDVAIEGTPRYMSPEQWVGGEVSSQTDIYSLGVVFFEAFVGQGPFRGAATPELARQAALDGPFPSLSERAPEVSSTTARIVERMVARDPAERLSSARELARLLASAQTEERFDASSSILSEEWPTKHDLGRLAQQVADEGTREEAESAADDATRKKLAPGAIEGAEPDAEDATQRKLAPDPERAKERVRNFLGGAKIDARRRDDVHFSVTSPPDVSPGECFVVDVWAHLHDQQKEVLRRARNAVSGGRIQAKSKGSFEVDRGSVLLVELGVKGLLVDEPCDFILWKGTIANATFPVTVPDDAVPGTRSGSARISLRGMQIGRLDFVIRVGPVPSNAQRLHTEEVWFKRAFASYASGDRDEVLARVHGMQKAAPQMSVFMDVLSLRSGDEWEQEILRLIPEHDIFYLFWSAHARDSKHVEKEWRCALETRGLDFIDPVPLVSPEQVPPPSELASKHFNDWTLAFRRRS